MPITRSNVHHTLSDLQGFTALIEDSRALVYNERRGSAQAMSPAELEFALRNTVNALICLKNAFVGFLERAEHDSGGCRDNGSRHRW